MGTLGKEGYLVGRNFLYINLALGWPPGSDLLGWTLYPPMLCMCLFEVCGTSVRMTLG